MKLNKTAEALAKWRAMRRAVIAAKIRSVPKHLRRLARKDLLGR